MNLDRNAISVTRLVTLNYAGQQFLGGTIFTITPVQFLSGPLFA